MLGNNVIPKAEDRVNITSIPFIVAYFIMKNGHFNVIDLLIRYIESFNIIRNPNIRKKSNLALRQLITYILLVKYNMTYLG